MPRATKPASQSTRTTAAMIHRIFNAKPSPKRSSASTRTRIINQGMVSSSLFVSAPEVPAVRRLMRDKWSRFNVVASRVLSGTLCDDRWRGGGVSRIRGVRVS